MLRSESLEPSMSDPTDFDRTLAKAIAELAAARQMGIEHSTGFLKQAQFHVALALDHARRREQQSNPTGDRHDQRNCHNKS